MMKSGLEDEEGPESSLRKLSQQFGVLGYVVLNKSGIPVKYQGMENNEATHYAGLVSELTFSTREFLSKKLFSDDDSEELLSLRLRSKKYELVITPDEQFTLIVIHDPNYVPPPVQKQIVQTDNNETQ